MKKSDLREMLARSEAQASRLADQLARLDQQRSKLQMENIGLQGSLDSAQRLRAVVLEEGITDLLRNPRRRVLVITPSGKVINGVVLNLQYEQSSESLTTGDMVAGLRSADLTIGLEP